MPTNESPTNHEHLMLNIIQKYRNCGNMTTKLGTEEDCMVIKMNAQVVQY